MIVGSADYQLGLSRLAFNFRGALSMEYLQNASAERVIELNRHSEAINEELRGNG